MRGLTFRIGTGLYALRLARIGQVLPLVALRGVEGADAAFAGLLNLRGRAVPVVDLARACTGRSEPVGLRSRIVLLGGEPSLGLLLHTTGETVAVPPQGLQPCPLDPGRLAFLEGVSDHGGLLLQWLDAVLLRRFASAPEMAASHA